MSMKKFITSSPELVPHISLVCLPVVMVVVCLKLSVIFPQRLRGFIKRREAGIFPFYSGMFPLLLLINLYRVYRQILSNHPPTLP